jgi:hypothetical protein
MDERWGTAGRSLLLINSPQTLLTTPFATVTNLRETLNEMIGSAIDVERRRRHALPARAPAHAARGFAPSSRRCRWSSSLLRACGSCWTTPESSGESSSYPRAIREDSSSRCRTNTR